MKLAWIDPSPALLAAFPVKALLNATQKVKCYKDFKVKCNNEVVNLQSEIGHLTGNPSWSS